jgi:hypothetical protein
VLLTESSLIALNFDLRGLDRAAHTTPLFELFTERFQFVGGFRYPLDDGHRFATATLCFPANPDNAVAD